jgi:hypothetical protein
MESPRLGTARPPINLDTIDLIQRPHFQARTPDRNEMTTTTPVTTTVLMMYRADTL